MGVIVHFIREERIKCSTQKDIVVENRLGSLESHQEQELLYNFHIKAWANVKIVNMVLIRSRIE